MPKTSILFQSFFGGGGGEWDTNSRKQKLFALPAYKSDKTWTKQNKWGINISQPQDHPI